MMLNVKQMIHDVPKPEISPNFTIDDIHKIREWHYEILKDATIEERMNFYNGKSEKVEAEIEEARELLSNLVYGIKPRSCRIDRSLESHL
jgi:hypothetical protein